nr:hypothetical protein Iba_chr02cCG3080 [Ipomoea batatas]
MELTSLLLGAFQPQYSPRTFHQPAPINTHKEYKFFAVRKWYHTSIINSSLATAIVSQSTVKVRVVGQSQSSEQTGNFRCQVHPEKRGVQCCNVSSLSRKQVVDKEIHGLKDNKAPERAYRPGLDEAAGEEEGGDNEPNDLIGEGGEGGGEGESFGEDGKGEASESPAPDGERGEDEAGDCGEEEGEELPALSWDTVRLGNGEAKDESYGD